MGACPSPVPVGSVLLLLPEVGKVCYPTYRQRRKSHGHIACLTGWPVPSSWFRNSILCARGKGKRARSDPGRSLAQSSCRPWKRHARTSRLIRALCLGRLVLCLPPALLRKKRVLCGSLSLWYEGKGFPCVAVEELLFSSSFFSPTSVRIDVARRVVKGMLE